MMRRPILSKQYGLTLTILGTLCLGLEAAPVQKVSAPDFVNFGVACARQNNYERAVRAYQKALAVDPHYIPAQVNLGLTYFKTGQYETAITWLERAAGQGLDSDQIHTLLAMSFYTTKRYRSAAAHFRVLFDREPTNRTAQYFLAESYFRSHQTQELSEFFEQLQTKAPDSPVTHMIAGERYDQLDRIPEAFNEFQQAAAIAPKMPFLHFALGYLYWEQHHFAESAAEFRQEIQLPNGEADQARGYLGDIAFRSGDRSAERLLRQTLRIDPNVRIAQYDLGVICSEGNRLGEAAAYFSKAIELDPRRADAYYRLARISRQLGETDRSSQLLAKVVALHASEHTPILQTVAQAR